MDLELLREIIFELFGDYDNDYESNWDPSAFQHNRIVNDYDVKLTYWNQTMFMRIPGTFSLFSSVPGIIKHGNLYVCQLSHPEVILNMKKMIKELEQLD